MASTHSPDHSTRLSGAIVGILVFLAGIALVGYVFAKAHTLFDAPPPSIPASAFATPAPTPMPSAATTALATAATPATATVNPAVIAIGQNLSQFIKQFLLLLLMCVVGAVVASLGINLFFKSLAAPRYLVSTGAPSGNTLTP